MRNYFLFFIAMLFLSLPVWPQGHEEVEKLIAPANSGVTNWEILGGLDLVSRKSNPPLKKILGKKVKLLGYMVPLDYENSFIKEFMLLPNPMNCTHEAPPAQNQVVHVKMKKGTKGAFFMGPIYLSGVLLAAKKVKGMEELPAFTMVGEEIAEFKGQVNHKEKHTH